MNVVFYKPVLISGVCTTLAGCRETTIANSLVQLLRLRNNMNVVFYKPVPISGVCTTLAGFRETTIANNLIGPSFNGTVVNRTCHVKNGGSLKISSKVSKVNGYFIK